MTNEEFYSYMGKNIGVSVNFGDESQKLDEAASAKDFAKIQKITKLMFRKQKKIRQMDYLLAYFIGKGANIMLHHFCARASAWEDSDAFKVFCRDAFDRKPGTIYKRYIRFYKFVTQYQLFLKVSNIGFDRCTNLITKFEKYFAHVESDEYNSVQRDDDRKKFLSFKFDFAKVRAKE